MLNSPHTTVPGCDTCDEKGFIEGQCSNENLRARCGWAGQRVPALRSCARNANPKPLAIQKGAAWESEDMGRTANI